MKDFIIFGSSPFIDTISKEQFRRLCENYNTIALNWFGALHFPPFENNPMVDYWIMADKATYVGLFITHKYHHGQKIIFRQDHFQEVQKLNKNVPKPFYLYEEAHALKDTFGAINSRKLFGVRNSCLPAIHWAIKCFQEQGAKGGNIHLIGIDLPINGDWQRGSNFWPPEVLKTQKSTTYIRKCRNDLYSIRDWANSLGYTINKVNPKSTLELPYFNIENL